MVMICDKCKKKIKKVFSKKAYKTIYTNTKKYVRHSHINPNEIPLKSVVYTSPYINWVL